MKNILISASICGLLVVNILIFTGSKKEPVLNSEVAYSNKVFPVKLPQQLTFAGETVPLDIPDVKERLDREMLINTYWHSNTLYRIKLAKRSFDVIVPILKENGVPEDFKYLAVAESGLQNVVSPAKAEGVWQFLKATGKKYGLEIENGIDERYHLEKSTQAACDYLKEAYTKFGTWTAAAAAYNMGIDGYKRQTERQREKNYYHLLLGQETSRYVFRILAIKEVFLNPKRYGFQIDALEDAYPMIDHYTVKVDSSIANLAAFSKARGTNYKTLKILNPWLRRNELNNADQKSYHIKLPR